MAQEMSDPINGRDGLEGAKQKVGQALQSTMDGLKSARHVWRQRPRGERFGGRGARKHGVAR